MVSEGKRGWSGGWRGTSSTARHQLLSEPLLDRCKIRTCLSPALGFNFLNVSLKVLLTGHPRRAGFRQGGFLCVHMTQLPRARSCLPRALSPTPCSPFPSQGGAPHQPLLNRFPWALSRGIRQRAQPPSLEYLIKMESLLTQELRVGRGVKQKGPFTVGTGPMASVASAIASLTNLWFLTPDGLVLWLSICGICCPLPTRPSSGQPWL